MGRKNKSPFNHAFCPTLGFVSIISGIRLDQTRVTSYRNAFRRPTHGANIARASRAHHTTLFSRVFHNFCEKPSSQKYFSRSETSLRDDFH